MLEGKKTFIGILIALSGTLGLYKYISEGDLTTFLNVGTELVGLAIAAYGRYKVKPK